MTIEAVACQTVKGGNWNRRLLLFLQTSDYLPFRTYWLYLSYTGVGTLVKDVDAKKRSFRTHLGTNQVSYYFTHLCMSCLPAILKLGETVSAISVCLN